MTNIEKVRSFAKELGITISLVSEEVLHGSGGLYLAPDRIYIDKDMEEDLIVLAALHELGHAASEKNDEVSDLQHDIYDEAYPDEKLTKSIDQKDKEIIRYIEARAMMYAMRLLNKLKLEIKQEVINKDNLYTILALEVILENGIITNEDIEELDLRCKILAKQGVRWGDYYKQFLN